MRELKTNDVSVSVTPLTCLNRDIAALISSNVFVCISAAKAVIDECYETDLLIIEGAN